MRSPCPFEKEMPPARIVRPAGGRRAGCTRVVPRAAHASTAGGRGPRSPPGRTQPASPCAPRAAAPSGGPSRALRQSRWPWFRQGPPLRALLSGCRGWPAAGGRVRAAGRLGTESARRSRPRAPRRARRPRRAATHARPGSGRRAAGARMLPGLTGRPVRRCHTPRTSDRCRRARSRRGRSSADAAAGLARRTGRSRGSAPTRGQPGPDGCEQGLRSPDLSRRDRARRSGPPPTHACPGGATVQVGRRAAKWRICSAICERASGSAQKLNIQSTPTWCVFSQLANRTGVRSS